MLEKNKCRPRKLVLWTLSLIITFWNPVYRLLILHCMLIQNLICNIILVVLLVLILLYLRFLRPNLLDRKLIRYYLMLIISLVRKKMNLKFFVKNSLRKSQKRFLKCLKNLTIFKNLIYLKMTILSLSKTSLKKI